MGNQVDVENDGILDKGRRKFILFCPLDRASLSRLQDLSCHSADWKLTVQWEKQDDSDRQTDRN